MQIYGTVVGIPMALILRTTNGGSNPGHLTNKRNYKLFVWCITLSDANNGTAVGVDFGTIHKNH